jgi:hypothetical protein
MNSKLEAIQRSLDMYLETKRQIFPRFYFISNDDLLEILGQSKNPEAIQPHLKKCFDNIKSVKMNFVSGQLGFHVKMTFVSGQWGFHVKMTFVSGQLGFHVKMTFVGGISCLACRKPCIIGPSWL